MNFPVSLKSIESMNVLGREGPRWLITLSGTQGWCWEYPYGLCIALAIERPSIDDEWMARSCLWLASMQGSLDDSLLLEGEQVLLVRRYDVETPPLELDVRINQQLAIACWFSTQGDAQPISTETNVIGLLV